MLRIALYICPQTICSSLSMAQDAFNLANRLAGTPCFELQRFSLDGQPVQLEFAQIQVDGGLQLAEQADLLIVPATGSAISKTLESNARLLPWLARRDRQQVASLCSSAFLLAAAGLLDGRQATTHWALAEAFSRHFPQVKLRSDLLLTEDGPLFCSGGAQAGLDLCLHLIAQHAGEWLAQQVASTMVIERQRGTQTRFAPLLPNTEDKTLAPLLAWLREHHAEAIDLNRLAQPGPLFGAHPAAPLQAGHRADSRRLPAAPAHQRGATDAGRLDTVAGADRQPGRVRRPRHLRQALQAAMRRNARRLSQTHAVQLAPGKEKGSPKAP
jgi:transcriptional regulator GlxA family with amidase domain